MNKNKYISDSTYSLQTVDENLKNRVKVVNAYNNHDDKKYCEFDVFPPH